ncbi:MAG: radical SAM family heme chaperone HemW [Malacoplasma sp.]
MKTKHLYIHIPFCKDICTYCNFYRRKEEDEKKIDAHIDKLVQQIKLMNNKFSTIYIGGGTPNYLSDKNLNYLLSSLEKNISLETEFSIECNPEFMTDSQAKILIRNKVNRISIGAQSLNNDILKSLNRNHNVSNITDAIDILYKNGINNISCDFIYNLPNMTLKDLDDIFEFIRNKNIKHISFYSLELKENSDLFNKEYKLDCEMDEIFFEAIKNKFIEIGYERYEISNWCISEKYYSQHNIAYWHLNDWAAIGNGAYGYEDKNYYFNNIDSCSFEKWDNVEIYKNSLIMGFRLIKGLNLDIQRNLDAYNYFRDEIKDLTCIKDNYLSALNIDFLHDLLLKII